MNCNANLWVLMQSPTPDAGLPQCRPLGPWGPSCSIVSEIPRRPRHRAEMGAEKPWQAQTRALDRDQLISGVGMLLRPMAKIALISAISLGLAGCGGNLFGAKGASANAANTPQLPKSGLTAAQQQLNQEAGLDPNARTSSVRDLFNGGDNPNTTMAVNKYLWNASLDVLNFLPIESVDPFTGVIVTGYGTPPGGGRAYRATILVQDPALDARSLKLSLQTKGGAAVSPETLNAVIDAILTRARQMRIADSKL